MKSGRHVVGAVFALAALSFVFAAAMFPGGGYDPSMRMLSALGRNTVRMVDGPWCRYLFMAGMAFSALGVLLAARLAKISAVGAALNAAGLVAIASVPEDASRILHDAACWLAAAGGAVLLFSWRRRTPSGPGRAAWTFALILPMGAMGAALVCHALGVLPFAPWVPSAQKLVILSFALWMLRLAMEGDLRRALPGMAVVLSVPVAAAVFLFARQAGPSPAEIAAECGGEVSEAPRTPSAPLSSDELAALAWLERVTAPMDAAGEREWWDVGGSQHGIFAKRYNIAFAGYAAAAVGMRGDGEVRRRAGKVLGDCVRRMVGRDVWAYSQSANYWGRKPWAPDPCHRENVMYTGHLLQLLALYELFTGDARYHRAGGGWDFEWSDGRKVHYDVEKLIGATVEQMRNGPNGGIACEPGLMFFACNNHPHVALSIFRLLGYGDWSADAARWEKWAIGRYLSPAFGGGEIGLVYHVRGNFTYPRGQDGHDGWSLLWYEAWAADRRTAVSLWRRARNRLDWPRLASASDAPGASGCCDPQPVPASVAAVFLAAAARACDDPETASRLEKAVDAKYLRRDGGLYRLDLGREWRVGATAQRIIALAEANGSGFRRLSRQGL